MVKIDTETRKIVGKVAVPAPPVQVYLTGDGDTLVRRPGRRSRTCRTLSIIDTREMNVTKSVQVGKGPHSVTLDPAAKTAWVTNLYDDTVSVIDLPRARVIATVPVGDKPNGISLSSRTPQPTSFATVPCPCRARATAAAMMRATARAWTTADHRNQAMNGSPIRKTPWSVSPARSGGRVDRPGLRPRSRLDSAAGRFHTAYQPAPKTATLARARGWAKRPQA